MADDDDEEEPVAPLTWALSNLLGTARGFQHQDHPLFDMQRQADDMAEAAEIYDRIERAVKNGDPVEAEAATATLAAYDILDLYGDDDDSGSL